MTRCLPRGEPHAGDSDARQSFEAWLRHSLAEQYRGITEEPLPAALLELLPRD